MSANALFTSTVVIALTTLPSARLCTVDHHRGSESNGQICPLGTFILLLIPLVLTSLAAQSRQAILQFPPPDGCHAVGTRLVVLRDASRNRDLIVTFWYPSLRGSVVAPYLDKRTASALAAEWKLQPDFADRVRTKCQP
jgi:hypothetical protein